MHVDPGAMTIAKLAFVTLALVATLGGCERRETDNPDVASAVRHHNKYDADIVTGTYADEVADQGKGVAPETMAAIDDRITDTYAVDFRHCLEDQMSAQDKAFLRAAFEVEFTVEPDGRTHDAHLLASSLTEQDAKGHDVGSVAHGELDRCIVAAVDQWQFDPAPEVTFVDTYVGNITEAF